MAATSSSSDVENGPRFQLNSDSFEEAMEPIPDLEGGTGTSTGNNEVLAISSSSTSVPEHTVVVNRMTTMEFLWRRHVRSRTDNATVQAMLDRILLIFLFFASLMEEPLKYLLGGGNETPKGHGSRSLQTQVTRGAVKTNLGVLAYRISQGRNPKKNPVLCFHADGRSSDEFLDILPLLADTGRRVVAIDLPGYGWSDNPKRSCTIDEMADACLKVADAMLIQQFVCLGISMGAVVGLSLASRYTDRVRGCVSINLLYSPTSKDTPINTQGLDIRDDGSHLVALHKKRGLADPDLSLRCIQIDLANLLHERARQRDGLKVESISDYDLEGRARKIMCPTMCVSGEAALANLDARGLGGTQRFDTACRIMPQCEVNTFSGPTSTVYMLNQAPKELSSLCASFLDKNDI